METDGILEQASEVVEAYARRRLAETARHKESCGCRSCTGAANRWIAWLAGDDDELYERLRFRFKGEAADELAES